jgi:predicted xylose isomerase-like sugar epimerase
LRAVKLAFGKSHAGTYKARTMNLQKTAVIVLSATALAGCTDHKTPIADVTAAPWECIAAKVTIGTNSIDTVVRFNKVNGEAQLLNAASFASKATGAQGNVIGWVPLGDLRNAVEELVKREQVAQQQMPAESSATPEPAPEAKKKN